MTWKKTYGKNIWHSNFSNYDIKIIFDNRSKKFFVMTDTDGYLAEYKTEKAAINYVKNWIKDYPQG